MQEKDSHLQFPIEEGIIHHDISPCLRENVFTPSEDIHASYDLSISHEELGYDKTLLSSSLDDRYDFPFYSNGNECDLLYNHSTCSFSS